MKKNGTSYTTLKGAEAKNKLNEQDARIKSNRSTTADVAEGLLKIEKTDKAEIALIPFVGRNGKTYDFPAIACKDSANVEHWVALSAFRAKDSIITDDGTTVLCSNLVEFDEDYTKTFEFVTSCKSITLHRLVGRRNGRKGRYEFFTFEK